MAELPTPDELTRIAQAAVRTTIDPDGTGAVNLRPGSRHDILVSVTTAVGSRLAGYVSDRVSSMRLSTATGEDLDVLARDLFTESRKPANAATGKIRLIRADATESTYIPRGTRFAVPAQGSTAAVVFESTEDMQTDAALVVIPVRCTETGPRGNIRTPKAVKAILDPLPDPTWQLDPIYGPTGSFSFLGDPTSVFAGGTNRESDQDLRARLVRISIDDPRQRATERAVLAATLRVAGVVHATVIEPLDGTILVFAGDENFLLSEVMRLAIDAALRAWRAVGVPSIVRPYQAQVVPITGTIHMARSVSRYDAAAIKLAATNAVKHYFASGRSRPDEYFVNAIENAMFSAHDEVQNVVLSAPAIDVIRPVDTAVSATSSLPRYRVEDASIAISIAGPLTT
jgi:hypothetical protein